MRDIIVKLLMAAAITALISGCASTDGGKPTHSEIKGKRVTIATGDFYEACDKFPQGQRWNIPLPAPSRSCLMSITMIQCGRFTRLKTS